MPRIHLVRHGRFAHRARGLDRPRRLPPLARDQAAAILETETPPAPLRELAATAGLFVASHAPRAIASANLLRDDFLVSSLLHELELRPPALRGLRLPLVASAFAIGARWLVRRTHASPAETLRAREAAAWTGALERVVAHARVTSGVLPRKESIPTAWK